MEYCSPLWDGAGQTVLGRLVRKQNRETMLVDERSVTVNILSLQTLRNVASLSLTVNLIVVAQVSFMIWSRLCRHIRESLGG